MKHGLDKDQQERTPTTNVVLLLLCGLPAAGKTSFAKYVVKCFNESYNVIHIEFDAFEQALKKKSLEACSSSNNPELWKLSRKRAISSVEDHIAKHKHVDKPTILIVDDNMYYRSMRIEMLNIARAHNTGFIQVFVQVDLQTAISRNTERIGSQKVSNDVIRRMHSKIEPPTQDSKHVIYCTAVEDESFVCSQYTAKTSKKEIFPDTKSALQSLVISSRLHPEDNRLKELEAQIEEQRNIDRKITEANWFHPLDLSLSKEVGKYIARFENCERKAAAAKARDVKKQTMVMFKKKIQVLQGKGEKISLDSIIEIVIKEFKKQLASA